MRLVQHPGLAPHRCAVLPYLGASNSAGFFDSEQELGPPGARVRDRVYVSFEAVCEMARLLGWVGPSVVKAKDADLASKQARIDQLEAELREADRFSQAIDVIESKDFRARQKRGPKPKKEAKA